MEWGEGRGERVQPGVVEAFLGRGSLPAHTNTITPQMSGNSWMVYTSGGSPGFPPSISFLTDGGPQTSRDLTITVPLVNISIASHYQVDVKSHLFL